MTFALAWAAYTAWLAAWIWVAWKQKTKTFCYGAGALVALFAAAYFWVDSGVRENIEKSGVDAGASFAGGIVLLFVVALTLVPVVLGLFALGIGKLWNRG